MVAWTHWAVLTYGAVAFSCHIAIEVPVRTLLPTKGRLSKPIKKLMSREPGAAQLKKNRYHVIVASDLPEPAVRALLIHEEFLFIGDPDVVKNAAGRLT